MKLPFALIDSRAKGPCRATDDSVGYDMFAFGDHVIYGGETRLIPVGFHAVIEPGYAAFMWDRSSMGVKGIHRFAGCIDPGYRGQWGVVLHNASGVTWSISHGDKIAQFVIQKCETPVPFEMSLAALLEKYPSERGQGGFGSTGR